MYQQSQYMKSIKFSYWVKETLATLHIHRYIYTYIHKYINKCISKKFPSKLQYKLYKNIRDI